MSIFYSIFQQTLMVAIAMTMVALGGMFSERSGVVNIALEGMMIIGAFVGVLFIRILQSADSTMNPQIMLLLAMLLAAIAGGISSLPLSYAAINIKADQTIGGTAINMLAPGLVILLSTSLVGMDNILFTNTFFIGSTGTLAQIPVIGDLFFSNTYSTIYVGIVIWIISMIVLYKTRFGMRLMACGEHPQAADSLGINVYKMRYIGVSISGFLAGLGGFMLVITTMASFGGNVNGYGFLSLAVLIFAQWKPKYILPAAFFFAFMGKLGSYKDSIDFLTNLGWHINVYRMLPYITTLIVLAFTSKKSRAPKASGIPYDQGKR